MSKRSKAISYGLTEVWRDLLEKKGFALPLHFIAIGANGSVVNGALIADFEVATGPDLAITDGGLTMPINMLIVDPKGYVAHAALDVEGYRWKKLESIGEPDYCSPFESLDRPAAPQGDFWDVVRVNGLVEAVGLLTGDSTMSKTEARRAALVCFFWSTPERVYIERRTTGERIDLTADMRKVEWECRRRRVFPPVLAPDSGEIGAIEDIIRAVLPPEGSDADEPPAAS